MTWKAFLETTLYLTVLRWIISRLWYLSVPNFFGALVKRTCGIEWSWLPEVYQALVVSAMLWVLWSPPVGTILTVLVLFAIFRPFEILVFLLRWILVSKSVVDLHRSLIGFIVNQAEIVLCFAVLFRESGCGADSSKSALYNSLRTAATVGPIDAMKGCEGLVSAEIVVAYLLTVLVIAAVVGKISQASQNPN